MIEFYKTINNKMTQLDVIEDGVWVNMVDPSNDELQEISSKLNIEIDLLKAALDEEEASHIDSDDEGNTLIIVDSPFSQEEDKNVTFSTLPIGVILTNKNIVTVCLKENAIIETFACGQVKNANTTYKTQFFLFLMLRIASRYLVYLKQIDRLSNNIERQLHKSMKNQELIQLLGLEKSLVFFSTSLKGNEVTLEKILRGRQVKLYDEDQDLLEDVLIEVKQAIEMSNIYSNILSGTMDAFASIISNNLNIVMKVLTAITIMMAIPTMVSSFYGMNVTNLPLADFWFPSCLSIALTAIVGIILWIKGMFK